METGSELSIFNYIKYHLAYADPAVMCLMKIAYDLLFQCNYYAIYRVALTLLEVSP